MTRDPLACCTCGHALGQHPDEGPCQAPSLSGQGCPCPGFDQSEHYETVNDNRAQYGQPKVASVEDLNAEHARLVGLNDPTPPPR